MAQPLVVETYDWLSKPAHGGIENPRMMHGEGWLPLFTGRAHLPGAHIATATAVHVIAIGLPLVAAGLGVSNEPWHGPWLNRFTAFTDAWRSTIRTWLPDLEGAIEVAEHSSRAVAPT